MRLHRIPLFTAAAAALLATASAQTPVTSPSGLNLVEGEVAANMFGAYPAARHMLFDGEMRNSAMAIKQVAMRDDFRPSTSSSSMGRSWSDVRLTLAECDMTNIVPTFSNNVLGTPTVVFSGSVSWPTNIGTPPALPAPWTKKFPFKTSWNYGGKRDICLDFDFNGGAMANNAAWTTSQQHDYYLDAYPITSFAEAPQTHFGKGLRNGCIDSGNTQGATNFLFCTAYGSNYHKPAYRNKYRLYTYSFFTGRGRPVANVVNFAGIPGGFPFPGITCNLVHLDLRRFLLVNVRLASSSTGAWSGFIYPTQTPDGLVTTNSSWAGLPMWAQAVWNDTKTNGMKLSRATMIRIPTEPRAVFRSSIHQFKLTEKNSFGMGPYTNPALNPILAYTK